MVERQLQKFRRFFQFRNVQALFQDGLHDDIGTLAILLVLHICPLTNETKWKMCITGWTSFQQVGDIAAHTHISCISWLGITPWRLNGMNGCSPPPFASHTHALYDKTLAALALSLWSGIPRLLFNWCLCMYCFVGTLAAYTVTTEASHYEHCYWVYIVKSSPALFPFLSSAATLLCSLLNIHSLFTYILRTTFLSFWTSPVTVDFNSVAYLGSIISASRCRTVSSLIRRLFTDTPFPSAAVFRFEVAKTLLI